VFDSGEQFSLSRNFSHWLFNTNTDHFGGLHRHARRTLNGLFGALTNFAFSVLQNLRFVSQWGLVGGAGGPSLPRPMVVHLINENIYFIAYLYRVGLEAAVFFAYTRSTPAVITPLAGGSRSPARPVGATFAVARERCGLRLAPRSAAAPSPTSRFFCE